LLNAFEKCFSLPWFLVVLEFLELQRVVVSEPRSRLKRQLALWAMAHSAALESCLSHQDEVWESDEAEINLHL
jgi:hypothetical protein